MTNERRVYCERAVDFVIKTFGMNDVLTVIIESLQRQIDDPTPNHRNGEKYIKVLHDDLKVALTNYQNRYADEHDE